MKAIRLAILSALLIWPPLSGAVAAALGVSLAHHHCDNVWHGHDHGIVAAGDEHPDCNKSSAADSFNCNDCGWTAVAIVAALPLFERAFAPRFAMGSVPAAIARTRPSLFRPPII